MAFELVQSYFLFYYFISKNNKFYHLLLRTYIFIHIFHPFSFLAVNFYPLFIVGGARYSKVDIVMNVGNGLCMLAGMYCASGFRRTVVCDTGTTVGHD